MIHQRLQWAECICMYRNTILQLTLIDRIYERNFTILASVANGAEIASISIQGRSNITLNLWYNIYTILL